MNKKIISTKQETGGSAEISSQYFVVKQDTSRGIPHHYVLKPKGKPAQTHLVDHRLLTDLRINILPKFMALAGITDLSQKGFRLIVDFTGEAAYPDVHLIAGDNVPAQNPQDWLTPQPDSWDKTTPAPFFDLCAAAAEQRLPQMKYGNRMFYPQENTRVFCVEDGDPKSNIHLLILAKQIFHTMVDEYFTADYWSDFFISARTILETLNALNFPTRYVIGFGRGYQMISRVHLHVQSSRDGLPKIFPHDYGFQVIEGGAILAPESSAQHLSIIRLIRQRSLVSGFSDDAKQQRRQIDQQIFDALALL